MIIELNNKTINFLKGNVDGFIIPKKLKQTEKIFVMTEDNKYVSMIFLTLNKKEMIINYIHTNNLYRKNGYSTHLVIHVINKIKPKKVHTVILPNSGSDILFKKLGFVTVEENYMTLSF